MSSSPPGPAPTIAVTLNGAAAELPAALSVGALIDHLAVRGRYAVEVNGDIVPRSRHGTHLLAAGDTIEVVHAIGGG